MPSSLGGGAPEGKKPSLEDEDTIKIQKPTKTKPAHPTPIIPGAKETIKLRPSNAAPVAPPPAGLPGDEDQETISMSKKTIRLVPKKPGTTTDDSTQKTAKPSAPTVKLGDAPPPAAAAPPAAPSAPTVKLPEPAAAPPPAAANTGKKTLKLKSSAKTVVAPPPSGGSTPPPTGATESDMAKSNTQGKKAKNVEKGANPGVVFTIAACFAFILMAYYTWMVIGQWAEGDQDMTKNANVPGLSGTVKAPR
jgi:hypothetical protein